MRTVTEVQRRHALVARHHLDGTATGPEGVARALIALHATDPASVSLSLLARCSSCDLAGIARSMYEQRRLVRWLAMRRTLFVIDRDDVPAVQAAIGTALAARLHTRLANRLRSNGARPPLDADVDGWIRAVSDDVEHALQHRGSATGAQLSADVPRLRTLIPARTASQRPETVTSSLLTVLGARGRIVRSTPTGAWTSRHHRWEPVRNWWPDGIADVDPPEARRWLALRWLERYGPATAEDLQWWTGWNATTTRAALAGLPVEQVDLHGRGGIALAGDPGPDRPTGTAPAAALLPALDPTPMGWKHRDWFFDIDPREIVDRSGNIGPTIWWDGRIVGSWAVGGDAGIRIAVRADHGAQAVAAIEAAADRLQRRLGGAVVTPAARTPLERTLTST